MNNWEKYDTYLFREEQMKANYWNQAFKAYMFPQGDGTMQFGMGVNELYCLGAFSGNADIFNKLMTVDLQIVLRPSLTWILRAKMQSGLGKGNPCYAVLFNDAGDKMTLDFVKFNNDGAVSACFLKGQVLDDIIDVFDYNRYEVGLINEDGGVRLLLRVNGKTLLDTVDDQAEGSYLEQGYMLFQGAYSTVQLRGTDSAAVSTAEKPVKAGEYEGIALYDISSVTEMSTRLMSTITTPLEFTADNGMTVKYRLYLPTHYDPDKQYPLYLHLHGGGARGSNNVTQIMYDFNQLSAILQQQSREEFIFLIPECPDDRFWCDSMTYSNGAYHLDITDTNESRLTKALMQLLTSIGERFSVDGKRLYLGGASMGGMGTYDILARYTDRFAAAWLGCGANDLSCVEQQAKTPLYILHGEQDVTIPVQWSRDTAAALEALHADFVYEEVKGRGHDFTAGGNESLERAFTWVFSHVRE
ncbi:MAG: dienelactone hydrolase family protein [Clostridia bacterium]|nr:dienelactone hydrolase family protein [Clostridia bacterium]